MPDDLIAYILGGLMFGVAGLFVVGNLVIRHQRKRFMRGWAEARGGRYLADATDEVGARVAPAFPFIRSGTRARDVVELTHAGVEITVFDAHTTSRTSQGSQTSSRTVLAAALPAEVPPFICRPRHAEASGRQALADAARAVGLPTDRLDRGYPRVEVGGADFSRRWHVAAPDAAALSKAWRPALQDAIDAHPGTRFEVHARTLIAVPEHSDLYYDEPLDAQVAATAQVARALTLP